MPIRFLQRFLRAEEGIAAIEFGIIAIPLFLLLMMTIECGIIYHISSLAIDAGNEAARLGMTGNLYGRASTPSTREAVREQMIKDTVKQRLSAWITSPDQITIDATSYGSFNDLGSTGTKNFGSGGQVVLYRVTYIWPVFTPSLAAIVGEKLPINAYALIKNEGF